MCERSCGASTRRREAPHRDRRGLLLPVQDRLLAIKGLGLWRVNMLMLSCSLSFTPSSISSSSRHEHDLDVRVTWSISAARRRTCSPRRSHRAVVVTCAKLLDRRDVHADVEHVADERAQEHDQT